MASNIGYRQFPEFDVRNDPETVYAHFVKYASKIANLRLQSETIYLRMWIIQIGISIWFEMFVHWPLAV